MWVWDPETGIERRGKVIDSGNELANNQARVEFLHGTPRVVDVTVGVEGVILAENEDTTGEMRRSPGGFAHAMRCDQMGNDRCWIIIDAYGPMEMVTEDKIRHWEPVYYPEHDGKWARRHDA